MLANLVCQCCGNTFRQKKDGNELFCTKVCERTAQHPRTKRGSKKPVFLNFPCKNCGIVFSMRESFAKAYQKKHGKNPLYCSMPCSDQGRRKDSDERNKGTCIVCGKEFYRSRRKGSKTIYREQKTCSKTCKHASLREVAFAKFERGEYGRHIKRNGYVWMSLPSLVTGKKRSVLEHRYVMSKKLGRDLLPDETVHHRDGNRQHNDISNLELFSSRHGPGQRVTDKVAFAIEILRLYPEFGRAQGVELVDHEPVPVFTVVPAQAPDGPRTERC